MVVQLCQLMHCVSWSLLNKQRILDATRLSSTVWKLWLKSLFHRLDLILLITMRRCDNSVVVAQPREVYAMQLQKPDVTRTGSQKSCNEKDCCSIMESINGGIYKVKVCMLEKSLCCWRQCCECWWHLRALWSEIRSYMVFLFRVHLPSLPTSSCHPRHIWKELS